ncbi:MAG TPA: metal ABC transporter permease [Myxococcota bacterium]|nr:metal ABC transporter permease [Myxococcota bacterium]
MDFLFGPGLLFRNAVVGGLFVAVVCSLLGVYLVLRRLVLLGVALPQAGAAGVAAAFWLTGHAHEPGGAHASALIGSLVATFGGLGLLLLGQRGGRSPAEWGVGALFAIASSATVLFVALNPSGDLEVGNLLRGELLAISDTDLIVLIAASVVAVALFFLFRREILLASFDAEFARTIGHNPVRADALLFVLIGGAIALGVMEAGPLVVFGFLVLPPLAALRVAPHLGVALALSAAVGALCSVGGFALAYHVDLPTGPTSVALAAGIWLAFTIAARMARRRWRSARAVSSAILVALAAAAAAPLSGCGALFGMEPAERPVSRGTLPDLAGRPPIWVTRFRNDTGIPLRIPSWNPFSEARRAVGRPGDDEWTVPDALQAQAITELAKRGVGVRGFDEARAAVPDVPHDAKGAAERVRGAGLEGPLLFGSLHRFTVTGTGMLLVNLDLALLDAASGEVIWTGAARRPVRVRSALTTEEILVDAGPAIFADAFGDR